jgi:hypothetical protein
MSSMTVQAFYEGKMKKQMIAISKLSQKSGGSKESLENKSMKSISKTQGYTSKAGHQLLLSSTESANNQQLKNYNQNSANTSEKIKIDENNSKKRFSYKMPKNRRRQRGSI